MRRSGGEGVVWVCAADSVYRRERVGRDGRCRCGRRRAGVRGTVRRVRRCVVVRLRRVRVLTRRRAEDVVVLVVDDRSVLRLDEAAPRRRRRTSFGGRLGLEPAEPEPLLLRDADRRKALCDDGFKLLGQVGQGRRRAGRVGRRAVVDDGRRGKDAPAVVVANVRLVRVLRVDGRRGRRRERRNKLWRSGRRVDRRVEAEGRVDHEVRRAVRRRAGRAPVLLLLQSIESVTWSRCRKEREQTHLLRNAGARPRGPLALPNARHRTHLCSPAVRSPRCHARRQRRRGAREGLEPLSSARARVGPVGRRGHELPVLWERGRRGRRGRVLRRRHGESEGRDEAERGADAEEAGRRGRGGRAEGAREWEKVSCWSECCAAVDCASVDAP